MYTYPTCSGIVNYTKFNNPIMYCLEHKVNPILFITRDYVKIIKTTYGLIKYSSV